MKAPAPHQRLHVRAGSTIAGRRVPLNNNRKRWDDARSHASTPRASTLIAEHYRAEGWFVEHVGAGATGRRYDGGIDLKLRRHHEYLVVQCKRWTKIIA